MLRWSCTAIPKSLLLRQRRDAATHGRGLPAPQRQLVGVNAHAALPKAVGKTAEDTREPAHGQPPIPCNSGGILPMDRSQVPRMLERTTYKACVPPIHR
jgi:hypothetical protein